MPDSEHITPDRVEMILQRLERLPTLSPIAVRLLNLSSSDESSLPEITSLVESDPALTAMLLSMCRRAATGLGDAVTTVERAVVMLGLDAVRSALLSVHVYELMERDVTPGEDGGEDVDRVGLWRRQLAAACAAERLAREGAGGVRPDDAFTAGLLHGLGKLALAGVLPKTYQRVGEYARVRRCSLADAERELIGIDHHTAGKRLGERWGLPVVLQDVMWLHGRPEAIPDDLPHAPLIRTVSGAVALARALHIGWGGDGTPPPEMSVVASLAKIDADRLDELAPQLHDDVATRAAELGLDELVDADMQMQSISAANRELARLNRALEQRARAASDYGRILSEVTAFHAEPNVSSLPSAYESIGRSASRLFGEGYYAVVHQGRSERPWTIAELGRDGRVVARHEVEPPEGERSLRDAIDLSQLSVASAALLGWLAEVMDHAPDLRRLRVLPMVCAVGEPSLLLHDRDLPAGLFSGPAMTALTSMWSGALGSAARHDGARRLQEKLADANHRLIDTREQLSQAESFAMLGRLTAGAAHEMNNPLAIIDGRAQVLEKEAQSDEERERVAAIRSGVDRLSSLISDLHFFAQPPVPQRSATDVTDLLSRGIAQAKRLRASENLESPGVKLAVQGPLPPAYVDGEQLCAAVTELLRNALASEPRDFVELRAETEGADDRLVISVTDLGRGMDRDTLQRATEPFFSRCDAGRRVGLGLARVRRLVEQHGGRLELESAPGEGTVARLVLPQWTRGQEVAAEAA